MAKEFLTKKQKEQLDSKEWNVLPNCKYIKLYQDEHKPKNWLEYAEILGFDASKKVVTVLAIATLK